MSPTLIPQRYLYTTSCRCPIKRVDGLPGFKAVYWPDVVTLCSLFARLDSRLRQAEDQKERSDLKKLNRKLKEVHKELQGHNQVLAKFLTTPENEWEGLVTSGRGSLSTSFFTHLENLVRASQDDIPKRDGKTCP